MRIVMACIMLASRNPRQTVLGASSHSLWLCCPSKAWVKEPSVPISQMGSSGRPKLRNGPTGGQEGWEAKLNSSHSFPTEVTDQPKPSLLFSPTWSLASDLPKPEQWHFWALLHSAICKEKLQDPPVSRQWFQTGQARGALIHSLNTEPSRF